MKVKFDEPVGENPTDIQFIDNKLIRIAGQDPESGASLSDEPKRVYIYKLDLMPPHNEEGEQYMTVIFRVVDNPIWFPALLLGFGALVGGGLTYAVVEDAGAFSEEIQSLGRSLGIAAALVSIAWFALTVNR